ncbi:MAG: L,D-transpeptidase/peptidoglycan binding protein [Lachnospiraceae bacterium]|nr:L,D-transpeptidase/peptidoglycan binding protein [Lachnospiraceae bacterium]
MSNGLKGTILGLFIISMMTTAIYFGLAFYYSDEFSYNTWINGVYCTGKSINQVSEELSDGFSYDGLTIFDFEGNPHNITAEEIDFGFDYLAPLLEYKSSQNPYLWIDNLFKGASGSKITPVIYYCETALENAVNDLGFFKPQNEELMIEKTVHGYQLVNNRANVLNYDKAKTLIRSAIDNQETHVDLYVCFEDLPLDNAMRNKLDLWPRIEEFQNCLITYQMGDELIPLDASIVSDWIKLNENGDFTLDENQNPILDEDKVKDFISNLAADYDTVGSTRQFLSSRGEMITVEGGIYGNILDQEAEYEWLLENFFTKETLIREPEYIKKGFKQGRDDIGDTYIEIDMTAQIMYFYHEGNLIVETPVVTGDIRRRWSTPEGVNYVYSKQRNRILRGEGYASPVSYWMPVVGNIGIHDASWRRTFGGDIYLTDGSRGCINTPFDQVKIIFDMAELGTPCVMYY